MSKSQSHSRKLIKFLLDENVKKVLLKFLESEGYDANFKPKLESFSKLLNDKSKPEDFEGFLIELNERDFEASRIPSMSESTLPK